MHVCEREGTWGNVTHNQDTFHYIPFNAPAVAGRMAAPRSYQSDSSLTEGENCQLGLLHPRSIKQPKLSCDPTPMWHIAAISWQVQREPPLVCKSVSSSRYKVSFNPLQLCSGTLTKFGWSIIVSSVPTANSQFFRTFIRTSLVAIPHGPNQLATICY